MARNVAHKLIADHLVEGEMRPGVEVGIRVDQTLTQDATGTMVMLELEVMGVVIGSSANPGLRDLAVPAMMVGGRHTHPLVSFGVNPTSRQTLEALAGEGWLGELIAAGARLHQAGCNGCIGMGQVPATGKASLRTFPRNFPGRSGTKDDHVYLFSPETAAIVLHGSLLDAIRRRQRMRS